MRRSFFAPLNKTEQIRIVSVAVVALILTFAFHFPTRFSILIALVSGLGAIIYPRIQERKKAFFMNDRFNQLWASSEERYTSLQRVFKASRAKEREELESLPAYVDSIRKSLFEALTRADAVTIQIDKLHEESSHFTNPNVQFGPGSDPTARAIVTQADRNRAEYRQNMKVVQGGVQRTEAQVLLFMTTVDNLRVRMVGYSLRGQQTEASSYEFSQLLSDMHTQLKSIDSALEELNLPLFPSERPRRHRPPVPANQTSSVHAEIVNHEPTKDESGDAYSHLKTASVNSPEDLVHQNINQQF